MHLSPKEIDKLLLHNAGFLAQKRYARGVALNYVEAVALLSAQLLEFIRDGDSVLALMEKGKQILGFGEVMEGIDAMIREVQVEGTFLDGTKLVTIHDPICLERGDPELALYGSGLTRAESAIPVENHVPLVIDGVDAVPGQTFTAAEPITLNAGRTRIEVKVLNNGDRPIQVGSHYPFFETNPALHFDRVAAFGTRLDIPAGTAVRFEPGESKIVGLVEIAGAKLCYGGNALIDGGLDRHNKARAIERMKARGFACTEGVE